MTIFNLRPQFARPGLLFALGVATLVGGIAYNISIAGERYSIIFAALVTICVFQLALWAITRIQRARGDIFEIVQTLNNIGTGKFSDMANSPDLPSAAGLKSAVNSMALEIQKNVDSLREVAQRDALTGLFNRAHFQRTVEPFMAVRDPDHPHCLIFIDLDGFKQINDTLGHSFGDRLLQLAADRLRIATHLNEFLELGPDRGQSAADSSSGPHPARSPLIHVARFGGDEFVVFLAHGASGTIAQKLTTRILRVLSEPFELGAHSVTVSASCGVAFFPQSASSYSELLRSADTAMYNAKRGGRNRCEAYSPSMDDEVRRAAQEEQQLREAFLRDEFELHFQPLYDIRTMKITSAEALIRWQHPDLGLLQAGQFIPRAERAGLMCQIGEWVVAEAMKRIGELSRAGTPLKVAINISPYHLEQIEFVSLIRANLNRWRAPANLVELEITEEVAIRDPELAAARLSQLSELGISIAIDDFGTGYSNLASLITLPLSRLKIDRSLLRDLNTNSEARILVQTIVSMANSLGFHSVAEGVETKEQLDLLSAMGCDVVQGYYLSKPVSLHQLKSLLAGKNTHIAEHREFTHTA